MMFGMETVPMTSSHVTEMKMRRWACGHTLRYHDIVRNDDIREILKVENTTEKCRIARLKWFGHVKRQDQEYVRRRTPEIVGLPPGRRKRGRQKHRCMDCVTFVCCLFTIIVPVSVSIDKSIVFHIDVTSSALIIQTNLIIRRQGWL